MGHAHGRDSLRTGVSRGGLCCFAHAGSVWWTEVRMTLDDLPEHLKSRKTAEAVMSPAAIVAGGAGAAVAIVAGAPLIACAAIGAVAYGALVALRLPRKPKPFRDI